MSCGSPAGYSDLSEETSGARSTGEYPAMNSIAQPSASSTSLQNRTALEAKRRNLGGVRAA